MPMRKRSKAKKTKSPRRFDLSFRPSYPRTRKSAFEIVRIAIASASRDAIVLSARRDEGRVRYRMVHEDAFGRTKHRIRVKPASSAQPLTLGELVAMLESACYAGPC